MDIIKPKMRGYKIPYKKGIDDLKSEYAFHGSSQGDESRSNSIEDYNAGWMVFVFNCELTDKAIAEQVEKNRAWNEDYINGLKEIAEYGEKSYYSINIEYNPAFDAPAKEIDLGEMNLWTLKTKEDENIN